jgi:hypothetical protein
MNINELKDIIVSENIPERYFLIGNKGVKDDKYCLMQIDGEWQVFYGERGKKNKLATFTDESDACLELLSRLRIRVEKANRRV